MSSESHYTDAWFGGDDFPDAPVKDEWKDERQDVLNRFADELRKATGDGSKKRQAGTKPPWYADLSHMAAVWSHFRKRAMGELVDPDSGAHPYVHAAWRLLAIACVESGNVPEQSDGSPSYALS